MNHFLDLNATDLARARTVSLLNQLQSPFPVLMAGSTTLHSFFITDNGAISSISGENTSSLRVTIGDVALSASNGILGLTVGNTAPLELNWDIDAAGLQNALNSNATVDAEGGVDVSQQQPGQFLIAYREMGVVTAITADAARLVPDCDATVLVLTTGSASARQLTLLTITRETALQSTSYTPITSPYAGWQGYIDLTQSGALELIRTQGVSRGGFIECQTMLTVEVIDALGRVAPIYQTPVLLRSANYAAISLTPTPSPATATQYFFAKTAIVGLASNSSNATLLGGLTTSTNIYPIGSTVQCQFGNDVVANFVRKGSTANQAVPFVVRPYDYNNTTNPYQWVLGSVSKQGVPATYDADTGKWTYIVTVGAANAVSVASDQIGFTLPA